MQRICANNHYLTHSNLHSHAIRPLKRREVLTSVQCCKQVRWNLCPQSRCATSSCHVSRAGDGDLSRIAFETDEEGEAGDSGSRVKSLLKQKTQVCGMGRRCEEGVKARYCERGFNIYGYHVP